MCAITNNRWTKIGQTVKLRSEYERPLTDEDGLTPMDAGALGNR